MTFFIKTGHDIRLDSSESIEVSKQLPTGTYSVAINPQTEEFYLKKTADLTIPSKLYGASQEGRANRIMTTFKSRSVSTGVLLTGEKGSGKTLLSKMLSVELLKQGTPTILINTDFCGQDFNKLITDITTPSVIIFDEFEKTYKPQKQEELLTLLDGTATCKHLYVFTANSTSLNSYMLNRPGRIYYSFNYNSLDVDTIEQYARDKLVDQTQVAGIIEISEVFSKFNFDMMQAIVEEMNRYNESAIEVVKVLNASPFNETRDYKVVGIDIDSNPHISLSNISYYPQNVEDPLTTVNGQCFNFNLKRGFEFVNTVVEGADESDVCSSRNDYDFVMTPETLIKLGRGGVQTHKFVCEDGITGTIVLSPETSRNSRMYNNIAF